MKKKLVLFAAFGMLLFNASVQAAQIPQLILDDQWKLAIGDNPAWATNSFDASSWKTVSSTKSWEDQGFPDVDGFGWYRKEVVLPTTLKADIMKYGGIRVCYDNADDADEFYFNGHYIGVTGAMPPAYVSKYGQKRSYTVPSKFVYFDRPNLMAVRVYDGIGGGGLITANTTVRPLSVTDVIKIDWDFPAKEWVFSDGDKQQMNLTLTNTLKAKAALKVVFVLKTDKFAPVDSIVTTFELKAGATLSGLVPFKLPAPGFYRCTLFMEKDGATSIPETFNIGYEPEKIVSPRDAKPDFDAFWKETRAQLDAFAPDFRMELMPERSTGARNLYHVTMQSYGNVTIEGYYAAPKAPGKYPAIITYMGYGSDPWFPNTDGEPGFANFVLSVRGQGIQKASQKLFWGDWIIWGLDSKDTYYYRGAFMDLVRGVDFLVSRPEVNVDQIVAEGGSQGGAFTLAACSLDARIKAAAPTIPFLSDYPDYFNIVNWPKSSFENYLKAHPDKTWKEVYEILTYFDIKNLTGWIKCPIFMAAGLQDPVCPPHTNFAAYNQIRSKKDYRIYKDQGHGTPSEWNDLRMKFFREALGLK